VASLPCLIAQRLEGSRFRLCFSTLATFGLHADATETRESERLPRTSQRFACSIGGNRVEKPLGGCIALGDSREPPVENIFWTDEALERISRVGLVRAKAAPLQALGDHTR
jgi:hypothetical protein